MSLQRTTAATICVGFLFASIQLTPGYVIGQLIDGSWGWVPQAATMAETIRWYTAISSAVLFLLGVACVFSIGYWTGRHVDLATDYGSVLAAIGAGGWVGFLAFVGTVGVYLLAVGPFIAEPPLLALVADMELVDVLTIQGRAVAVPIQFGLVGFAGASLAHFAAEPESLADRPTPAKDENWSPNAGDS